MRWSGAFGLLALLLPVAFLSGCSESPAQITNQGAQPKAEALEDSETSSNDTSSNGEDGQISPPRSQVEMPPEWSNDERAMFELYGSIYQSYLRMDLGGKRALMDNAYLICEAYSQGISRIEIQRAISGGPVTPQMADDWMSLSVTYICPEFFDEQMR